MIEVHAFENPSAQCEALAQAVHDALAASLAREHATSALLAVSGGTSPRPFLHTLSGVPLDWSRIDVTLIDERWVADTDDASNARLVRETLLQDEAVRARFLPLADLHVPLAERIAALNADPAYRVPDVGVLGMGEDGHTASIFADAPEWAHASSTPERFVAVHPGAAPHARVSYSLDALKRIGRLFLLIAGERKREVLEAAAANAQRNAISLLAHDERIKLDVYWCAN